MESNSSFILIERLAAIPWLLYVLPYLVYKDSNSRKKCKLYFIDGTKIGVFLAKLTIWSLKVSVEKLQFQLADIKDNSGNWLDLRILYFDITAVQRKILESPDFQEIVQNGNNLTRNRISRFLAKQAGVSDLHNKLTIKRALTLIHVARWKAERDLAKGNKSILFMNKRVWVEEVKNYALQYKVEIIPVNDIQLSVKCLLSSILRFKTGNILKNLYFCFLEKDFRSIAARVTKPVKVDCLEANKNASPKLGVEYYGHLNLEHPELHSDLFFWQQSPLSGKDILITFNIPSDPIDKKKLSEINRYQMSAVALSAKAKAIASTPVFYHWPGRSKSPLAEFKTKNRCNSQERKWLFCQIRDYYQKYDYWRDFFVSYNVKVFMTWHKYTASHYTIADALRSIGGISAIYQRAFEEFPAVETTTNCDVAFGFSPNNVKLEKEAGSHILYHISAGYFGDHRFSLVKPYAERVRKQLRDNGAKRILAYFDENSHDDSRWHSGHEFMRLNYEFLLDKVLKESWLGLALKPKVAWNLRKRLGPVAGLLKQAEETGRCFVFEGGALTGTYPPAIAAFASDVTIHGHLWAATAGMESALAGVPTLLLDREGWPVSSLHRLARGRVVFTDWHDLWRACQEHWESPKGIPGFGDWSSIINEIDPFRDGRAAERIGTYLSWLLEGFKAGLSRDTILADAAARYTKIWGKDKVADIGGGL